jgi:site-specific DNA-methyltransferase (adenine-specific)
MARINRGLFTSLRGDWRTPKALYQALDAEFHFDYDPCPAKPKVDGLASEWGNINFVNPPYGKEIRKWVEKGFEQYLKGKTIVFLLPSRTDTAWWHDFVMKAHEIRFIRGRLKFDDQKNSAPFPSAIAVFKHKEYGKQNK